MGNLAKYDAACRAIFEAKSVDEVEEIRDKAEAMRAYARQAKNKDMEIDAAEIRIRAERRLGEMIVAQKQTVGLATGGEHGGKKRIDGTRAEPSNARPTLAEAGIDKKLSARAQKIAAVPQAKFEEMVGEWRGRIEEENERVTVNLLREGARAVRDEKLSVPALPKGKSSVIYADPPWRYDYSKSISREIENQYPTLSMDEICALPISDLADGDAVLFLWATSPKLAEAMDVISAWGFTYRTCAVWDKEIIGMGYYFRQQHELLLIGTRGSLPPPIPANRPSSVIHSRRSAHSEKPKVVYEIIEAMYPGLSKVELFSRSKREGWAAWGNQAEVK